MRGYYAAAMRTLPTVHQIQQIPFSSRLPKYTMAALAEEFDMGEGDDDTRRRFRQIIYRHRKGSRKYSIPRLNNVEIALMAQDWFNALSM